MVAREINNYRLDHILVLRGITFSWSVVTAQAAVLRVTMFKYVFK